MAAIKETKVVPYSVEEMYELVNRVENYQHFLPWCSKSDVHHRDEAEVKASLTVAAMGFEKSFTTLNRLQHNKMIEVSLVEGPLEHLEGFWRFNHHGEKGDGCEILLDLRFEFSGGWMSMAFEPVFHQVASTLMSAFCQHADSLFANKAGNTVKQDSPDVS